MRLLIIASVSLDTVIWPFMTSCTRSLSQTLAAGSFFRALADAALLDNAIQDTAGFCCGFRCGLGLCGLFGFGGHVSYPSPDRLDAGFRAGLLQHFLILDDFLQEVIQLLVTDQTAADKDA